MIPTLVTIAVLLAAEWLTRPPTVGRRHAPQTVHRPRRHGRGRHEASA